MTDSARLMFRINAFAALSLAIVVFGAGGTLALEETAGAGQDGFGQHGERMFDRLDTNGDGAISRAEMVAGRAVARRWMDTDGDGAVTEAEMRAAIEARIAARVAKRFARLDSDGDGRIGEAEFAARDAERFDRLDGNGDGVVTREEIRAAMARWRRE